MKLLLLVLLALVALSCGTSRPGGVDGGVDVPTASPDATVPHRELEDGTSVWGTAVAPLGGTSASLPEILPNPTPTTELTTTTTTPAPTASTGTVQDSIRAAFARFGPAVEEQAVRVGGCESTFRADAYNAGSVGVMQINVRFHLARIARLGFTPADMNDPTDNAAVAADIYGEQGWTPWSCRWAA